MQIFTRLQAFKPDPAKPLILGLGNFDGIHLGHQVLLDYVVGKARKENGLAAVMTFQEHPQQVLHPQAQRDLLISNDYKLFLLKRAGVDLCFWLAFNEAFSRITAESFVREILVQQLQVHEICMGYNAHFGKGREGDATSMQRYAAEQGFLFEKIEPVRSRGDFVSSSRVRELVRMGDLKAAEACLGHPFRVLGRVITGAGRGRALGYPTANLDLSGTLMPPQGVYPIKARLLEFERDRGEKPSASVEIQTIGEWMPGILNYGTRPTFGRLDSEATPVAEAHLLDFEGDIQAKRMELSLYGRLREEKTFNDAGALKTQIARDIDQARLVLA